MDTTAVRSVLFCSLAAASDRCMGQTPVQVDGAVGAYNSLIVADLDGDGHQELYAAGSLGLRRWIFQ